MKFKIGDKVKVVKISVPSSSSNCNSQCIGDICIINNIEKSEKWLCPYYLKRLESGKLKCDRRAFCVCYAEDEIQKVSLLNLPEELFKM